MQTVSKTAFHAACQYLESVQEMIGGKLEDLRLEEAELSDDRNFWLITLGFDVPIKSLNTIGELLTVPNVYKKTYRREYKTFKVNAQTGEVEAMKIRQL
ncbi:MAG: hypothetical protein HC827_14105 [Cyanobacteria bacterium RM1_2_2]|nr:hypothetical protein [Cyanobacteria bacterium RM1_2_2]